MKVTISELRSMIREALQEKIYNEEYIEEAPGGGASPDEMREGVYQEDMVPESGDPSLEEAWNELEEAAGVVEEKKEEPLTETIRALVRKTLLEAKKAEEKPKAKPEPAKKEKEQDKGMYSLSVSQLKAMRKLNNNDFNKCLSHMKKGMPVGMALKMCRAKVERD
jgi:antitoxin component HigA of HigAB toxin-antitoxin module